MPKTFHNLEAFKAALDLMVEVYRVTADFPRSELYGLTSQLRKAAVGVVSQIAEGQGRLTYGEWRQFLSQARGSLYEVEAELLAAEKLGFLTHDSASAVKRKIAAAGPLLSGLIRWVRRQELQRKQQATSNRQPNAKRPTPHAGPPATQPQKHAPRRGPES